MIRLLYGSPFDPIHDGHLAMLKAGQQHLRADEVTLSSPKTLGGKIPRPISLIGLTW
jgi:nicotinic acid mononucleotide adenylyltransferase